MSKTKILPVLDNELELVGSQYGNKLCSSTYHTDCDNQRLYYRTVVVPTVSQHGDDISTDDCEDIESGKAMHVTPFSNCANQTDNTDNSENQSDCDTNIDTSMKEFIGASSKAICEEEANILGYEFKEKCHFDFAQHPQ